MNMVKVSIVVPCYKAEKYIRELIESLQKQTLEDIEIILVNDGSPDRTGEICDEYVAKDSRFRIIHKINGGVSAARNDGLRIATGEYVIFADSDDYLPENAIELLYTKAVQTNADIVIGDVNQVFHNREKMGRFYAQEFTVNDKIQIQELIKTVFYKTYCPWPYQGIPAFGYGGPCNKLVRRKMLNDNGIEFDVRVKGIYDDIIYSAYILIAAKTVAYIPQNVYNYRILETSITNTYKKNILEINQAIFAVWNEFLQKYNMDEIYTAAYYANVLRRFDESLSKYFFNVRNSQKISECIKELQRVIDSTPYKDISKYADKNKLERRHRMEFNLLKKRSARSIWIFYSVLCLYRKFKER